MSLGSPLPKSVIFSFMHSHFKNRPNCYSRPNHQTDKPHHLPSQTRLFQPEPNPSVQVHYKQSSLLHSLLLLYSENASKTTHAVTKLFTRQGEQPGCYSLAPMAFFFSLYIYLTSGVLEQPAVMLEQTSTNRSAVLRDISPAWESNTNKGNSWH